MEDPLQGWKAHPTGKGLVASPQAAEKFPGLLGLEVVCKQKAALQGSGEWSLRGVQRL